MQGCLRNRINGGGQGQGLDVQDARGFGVLGSCAGPKKALRAGSSDLDTLPPRRIQQRAICLISLSGDGDAKLIAQGLRHLLFYSDVPTAGEQSRHGTNIGIESGGYAPLDAAHVSFGCGGILLSREQQGYIYGNPSEYCLLNGCKPLPGAGNLDEKVGSRRALVECPGCGESTVRVMRQQGRHLQGYPAIHAVGSVEHRPEEISRLAQIHESQLGEQFLA